MYFFSLVHFVLIFNVLIIHKVTSKLADHRTSRSLARRIQILSFWPCSVTIQEDSVLYQLIIDARSSAVWLLPKLPEHACALGGDEVFESVP
jgi:hypothetical protein